jgi:hypothetical protein
MSASLQRNNFLAFLGFRDFGNQLIDFRRIASSDVVIYDDNLAKTKENAFIFVEYKNHPKKHQWFTGLGYTHLTQKPNII